MILHYKNPALIETVLYASQLQSVIQRWNRNVKPIVFGESSCTTIISVFDHNSRQLDQSHTKLFYVVSESAGVRRNNHTIQSEWHWVTVAFRSRPTTITDRMSFQTFSCMTQFRLVAGPELSVDISSAVRGLNLTEKPLNAMRCCWCDRLETFLQWIIHLSWALSYWQLFESAVMLMMWLTWVLLWQVIRHIWARWW